MEGSLNVGENRSSFHLDRHQTLALSLTHSQDEEMNNELEIIEHIADSYFDIILFQEPKEMCTYANFYTLTIELKETVVIQPLLYTLL